MMQPAFIMFAALLPVMLFLSCGIIVPTNGLKIYQRGASLHPLKNFWISDNEVFAFGFVSRDARTYSLSIYYAIQEINSTVVWTAQSNQTISSNASLVLAYDGNLVLTDGGAQVWQTNTGNQGITSAKVSDAGALLLLDNASNAVWQSNQSLTDTLLAGQTMLGGSSLVSEDGRYMFAMQTDSNLVMYYTRVLANQPLGSPYFASMTNTDDNSTSMRVTFDDDGNFYLLNRTGPPVQTLLRAASPTPKLMRLQFTRWGLLILYGWNQGDTSWRSYGQLPSDMVPCSVRGICGQYGICDSLTDPYACECPKGFQPVDNRTFSTGCVALIPFNIRSGWSFVKLLNVYYHSGRSFDTPAVGSETECMKACSDKVFCMAAQYISLTCSLMTFGDILSADKRNGAVAFLKVSQLSGSNDSWTEGASTPAASVQDHVQDTPARLSTGSIVGITVASVLVGSLTLGNLVWFCARRTRRYEDLSSEGTDEVIVGVPIKFSYGQLRVATNGFRDRLGRGGFGSVYKGILAGGSAVAVKKLESPNQGAKQFQAEVATIGAIHHINLVRLRGFCAEGFQKLLAYEYMPNGSLDHFIFSARETDILPRPRLDWKTRFSVAYGTAKAISYLHEECTPSIIHCDVKPENILLDVDFSPKVSDFGLAKLIGEDLLGSITHVRGTIGYMAPEWITSSHITVKADVYSYGVVLLEMISGRRNPRNAAPRDNKVTYYEWAYQQLSIGNSIDLLDPVLEGQADLEQVKRTATVAFWCIQEDPNARPSMQRAIQMLDGTIASPLPPPPSFEVSYATPLSLAI